MGFLAQRKRQPEWMDAPDVDPQELDRALGYIRRLNRLLGFTRQTLSHLQRLSRGWPRERAVRVLDVATGSADIPIEIVRWGLGCGFNIHVTAVDLHDRTLSAARTAVHACEPPVRERVQIFRADALALPFAAGAFDYSICSLFLHHLSDAHAVEALREMDRVAARGIIVCDLLRHYRAYAWINLLTLFASPVARHDARVSVTGAYSRQEALDLRARANVGYAAYFRHFAHRFALAGEKTSAGPGGA